METQGGALYYQLSVMPLKSDGSLCIMEALIRSQQGEGVMPASSPKLEDFLGGATMGAHEYGFIDRKAMSLSLDSMYYQHNLGHGNLWMDLSNFPELKSPELSESSLYSYIHQYIQSLERDARLDMIEGINEKIRKRFKNPKLSNSNCAKICKHAFVAWCRSILISLALITPLLAENASVQAPSTVAAGSEPGLLLYLDLQTNDLWSSSFEDPVLQKALETKWSQVLSTMKHVHSEQASEENMEAAATFATLLRYTYNFYRESSCGTLPSGINLYTVPSHLTTGGLCQPSKDNVDYVDLSAPRKLLLWAYTLVHGRYSNILAVVKHCEENAKFARVEGPRVIRDVHRINSRLFPCQTVSSSIL